MLTQTDKLRDHEPSVLAEAAERGKGITGKRGQTYFSLPSLPQIVLTPFPLGGPGGHRALGPRAFGALRPGDPRAGGPVGESIAASGGARFSVAGLLLKDEK